MARQMYSPMLEWYSYSPEWDNHEIVDLGFYAWGDASKPPRCPQCGSEAEYNEGAFDQDEQGNNVYGWCYDCPHCFTSTQYEEF